MRERFNISEARKRFSSLLKNLQREPGMVYEITVNDIVVGELRAPEHGGYRVGTGRDLLASLADVGGPKEGEDLYLRLRLRAETTGKSMAEQIKESVERYLAEEELPRPAPDDSVWNLVGAIDSGRGDLAERHDHYLYDWDKGTTK